MTPALSQSGNARDGLAPSANKITAAPPRVFTDRNRYIPLEPSKDTRPFALTAWLSDWLRVELGRMGA